jgi:hypothetical protein
VALDDILASQNNEIEAMTAEFERQLTSILSKAQARVLIELKDRLKIEDNTIVSSSINRRVLRELDHMLLDEANKGGLRSLLSAYVGEFPDQFKYFHQILDEVLNESDLASIIGEMRLTESDKDYLALFQKDSADNLESVVSQMADEARRKAFMSIGGASVKDVASTIAETVGRTPGVARSEAATAVSSFYRSMADLSFKKIEEDDNWTMKYRYVGPPASDPIIRPFCEHLMAQSARGRSWTRPQIDAMDNHQLDNVFVTGGGYNCRHQWIVADMKRNRG